MGTYEREHQATAPHEPKMHHRGAFWTSLPENLFRMRHGSDLANTKSRRKARTPLRCLPIRRDLGAKKRPKKGRFESRVERALEAVIHIVFDRMRAHTQAGN